MLVSKWNISILPAHLLPQGASFGALKIAVSPVTAVHKSALLTITTTALNEINQSEQSRKWGVWKNESLSESFESRWANKVKINAYYKKIKVFFFLPCMHVNLLLGTHKATKKEHFITHTRGTLKLSLSNHLCYLDKNMFFHGFNLICNSNVKKHHIKPND